ncbi:MAG: Tll0287-like domain-containing protein, partial [Nitrospirales bacterium]
MKSSGSLPVTLFAFLSLSIVPFTAFAGADAVETGRLLAILLDSGRVVVGLNQPLINDKEKGDKGFTPDVFEKQLQAKFRERAGVDLANLQSAKVPAQAKTLLPALVVASKQTVGDNQSLINKKGTGFKGFTPANFGTQAAAKFTAKTNVYLKQTTLDSLLRNPNNKADEYEAAVLAKFADPSYPRQGEKVISNEVEGGKAVRLLLPLFYGKACLGCHGEPKGETDISGY